MLFKPGDYKISVLSKNVHYLFVFKTMGKLDIKNNEDDKLPDYLIHKVNRLADVDGESNSEVKKNIS